MKILAADDERAALNILVRAITEAAPDAELAQFSHAAAALDAVAQGNFLPDVAFLDIEMPGITGLELAKRMKELCPQVNIVFITGFSQYALDALAIRPSGYVMKPVSKDKILNELANLRNPPPAMQLGKYVRVQCFGNFEVFALGRPIRFTRSRAKELFAYLVDRRGAYISAEELMAILWEDRPYSRSLCSNFRNTVADLVQALKNVGAEDVLLKNRSSLAILPGKLDCDYYSYLRGDSAAINSYYGEYMSQYSWAEMTTAALEKQRRYDPAEGR